MLSSSCVCLQAWALLRQAGTQLQAPSSAALAQQALPCLMRAAAALAPQQQQPQAQAAGARNQQLASLSTAFLRKAVRRLHSDASGTFVDEGPTVRPN